MERVIKLSELREAVNEAYEQFKSVTEGTVDPRVKDAKPDSFAISVALTDGTVINKGDAGVLFPLGQVDRVAITTLRAEQKSEKPKEDKCDCHEKKECNCSKLDLPFCVKGIRRISRLQPKGDADSKWNFIENCMISMIGSAPTLDVKLYEDYYQWINVPITVVSVLAVIFVGVIAPLGKINKLNVIEAIKDTAVK